MAEGNFAIFDINEYDKLKALLKLRGHSLPKESRRVENKDGWLLKKWKQDFGELPEDK